MPSNKDRLYVALYARGGKPTMPGKEDTYHWALIVGPKVEEKDGMGCCYHVKEKPKFGGAFEFFFEERECPLALISMLLVCIMVGKVLDGGCLVGILWGTPIQQQQGWNCVSWVADALGRLKVDTKVLGMSVIEWDKVCNKVMEYCQ